MPDIDFFHFYFPFRFYFNNRHLYLENLKFGYINYNFSKNNGQQFVISETIHVLCWCQHGKLISGDSYHIQDMWSFTGFIMPETAPYYNGAVVRDQIQRCNRVS